MILPQLLFLVCLLCLNVNAVRNITVDDNDGSITYDPPSSWIETDFDVLNFGGRHMVTSDISATATFTFTGISIYFYSPLWPFRVTTALSLDGEPAQLVDLMDPNVPIVDDGPETVESQVIWSVVGLENREHTLVISVGEDIAIVDALTYTILESTDLTSSISAASSSTSSLSSSTHSKPVPTQSSVSAASSSSSKRGLSIALGLVLTIFGVLVIWAVFWYWRRRRREEESRVEHDNAPEMSDTSAGTYASEGPRTGFYSRPRNPTSRYRPVPNIAIRRAGSSAAPSPLRHSTTAPPKKNNPLTTIPEIAAREDGWGVASGGGGGVANSKGGIGFRPSSTAGPYHPDGADRGHISPGTSLAVPPWTEFDSGRAGDPS